MSEETTDHAAAIHEALERYDNHEAELIDTADIIEHHADALAAERDALRAYARALEWHLRQQYGVDDDHPVFDQIRKAHNAAALMDADR